VAGKTEIADLDEPTVVVEEVGEFYVSVDHGPAVKVLQGRQKLRVF